MGFPEGFLWGASSAAFQVEGSWDADGKTPSIWDALSEGHIKDGSTGAVACDHYRRYQEDAAWMKKLGLKSYRFSVSWSRVMPAHGVVNEKGLAFYSNLVDQLTEAGIEPLVTLYHWDMPMWVYENGGWENEQTTEDFAAFTAAVVDALSDRVRYWITFNEPGGFVNAGYNLGVHAPFRQDPEKIGIISRNVMLAHGKAVQVIRRRAKRPAKVGMAPDGGGVYPWPEDEAHIQLAKEATYAGTNVTSYGWWADTMVLGRPPEALRPLLSQADLDIICQKLDYFGFNLYQCDSVYGLSEETVRRMHPGMPLNQFGRPITPKAMYYVAKWHYERYGLPLMVCENGFPNRDWIAVDGQVHDPQRIDYMTRYLLELERAMDEGVEVLGYHYWSLTDNMEWCEGYDPRFGLIYVDFRTQARLPKDSAWFYRDVIASRGRKLHETETPHILGCLGG